MTENKMGKENTHNVKINARARTEICGVESVESFDEQSVVLATACGEMTVEGEGLHVSTLDMERGIVMIDGRVGGIWYGDTAPTKRGLRGKFFG